MKTSLKLTTALAICAASSFAFAASLEERVSELEAQQSLNYFKFSGLLETRYDSLDTKQTKGATIDARNNYMRLKSSLNVDADVSQRTKVYTRFTATKFMNGTAQGTAPTASDLSAGRDYRGSAVYVEKAYTDITAYKGSNDSIIFSMGRLPTVDGPPVNLVNGRARQGTYPALAYGSILDGMALSYNRDLGDNNSFAVRAIYTPLQTYTVATSGSYLNSPTAGGNKVNNSSDLTSLMLEWNKSGMSWADNIALIYQGYQTGPIYLDGNTIAKSINSALTGTGSASANIEAHTLTLLLDNVAHAGIDFAASYIATKTKNEGTMNVVSVGNFYGLGAESEGDTVSGGTALVALRYKFSPTYYLGGEYLDGSKNSFVYNKTQDSLTGFYETHGTASHVYFIYKALDEFAIRLGYTEQNYKYGEMSLGPVAESDRKVKTMYANFRLDF